MKTDNPLRTLSDALSAWSSRLSRRRGLRRAGWVTLVGVGAVALFIVVAMFVPIPAGALQSPGVIAAIGLAAVALAAAAALVSARYSQEDAAQVADLRHDTGALFTTAWGASGRDEASLTPAERACLAAAAARAAELSPAEVAPIRFGWRWAVVLLYGLAAALAFIPFAEDTARAAENARLESAAEELAAADKRLEKLEGEGAQALDPALRKELRRLQRELQQGDLSSREALEQIGELKRKLRAEQLARAAQANETRQGAREASRELGRNPTTSELAQKLADSSREGSSSQEEREQKAKAAGEALKELKKRSPEEQAEAAESLKKGAEAARKGGDPQLAKLLEGASQALQGGDPGQLDKLGEELSDALERGQGGQDIEELARSLEAAQARLAGIDPSQPGQKQGQLGDGPISPGPRDWSKNGGEGNKGGPGAGTGHQDEEATPFEVSGGHTDSDRTKDRTPEVKDADYMALYESANLQDSTRVLTQVKGEKSGEGIAASTKGGQQAPGDERARNVLEALPAGYAEDAQKAVNTEEIPPGYRDAVRDYFDARK